MYMALLETVDQSSEAVDQKYFTVGFFVDLSKAFETVNHKYYLTMSNFMVLWDMLTRSLVFIFRNVNNMSCITIINWSHYVSPVGCLKVLT